MKIYSLNNLDKIQKSNFRKQKNLVYLNNAQAHQTMSFSPANAYYNQITFQARTKIDTKKLESTLSILENQNHSIIDYLSQSKSAPQKVYNFLLGITSNEKLASKFIKEINFDPKKADAIASLLIKKIGGSDNFKKWYFNPNGYQRAYENYFKKEIFENDNVTLNDMVKISPNLLIESMKLKSLKTTGTTDFVLGNVPKDIGTIEDFRQIAKQVRESILVKEFIKFRDFMEDTEAFSEKFPKAKEIAINPARFAKDFIKYKMTEYRDAQTSVQKSKLEAEIPFLKYLKETQIIVNGKEYTYKPILRPYSTKILYSLQQKNAQNKYFVTMEMFNPEEKTCENIMNKENSCMRSDSPYLNAMVDYYLRSNGCENVPEMKFYDFKSNAVIYPFINGKSIKEENRLDDYGVVDEYSALKKEMKPLTELGIFIADCFYENFMKDEKTGKILIVDNGHAKFSNILKPGVKMIHMGFQDLYGRDYVNLDAGINRALNK